MRAEITPEAQEEYTLDEFREAYEDAIETATITSVATGEPVEDGDTVSSDVDLETRIFGDAERRDPAAGLRRRGRLDARARLPRA